ncbi:acetate--CoA ligase family protein, partial [Teichococcus wenyumeiae]
AAWAARPAERPTRLLDAAPLARARALLASAPGSMLPESAAKAVLAECGLPVVAEELVPDLDAALRAADRLGYPVVLKAESPDLPHKTEAGVVRLDLRDAAMLREAYGGIEAALSVIRPAPRLRGMLVQPMVPRGVELIIGARRDPVFGPVVAVGLGGVLVELLQDTAVAPAPLGLEQAGRMLRGLRGYPLLAGFRGGAGVDLEQLAAILCRVAELVAAEPGIAELDINPLICAPGRILAVDALIALSPGLKAMDAASAAS